MTKIVRQIDPLNKYQCKVCGRLCVVPSLVPDCKHKDKK